MDGPQKQRGDQRSCAGPDHQSSWNILKRQYPVISEGNWTPHKQKTKGDDLTKTKNPKYVSFNIKKQKPWNDNLLKLWNSILLQWKFDAKSKTMHSSKPINFTANFLQREKSESVNRSCTQTFHSTQNTFQPENPNRIHISSLDLTFNQVRQIMSRSVWLSTEFNKINELMMLLA